MADIWNAIKIALATVAAAIAIIVVLVIGHIGLFITQGLLGAPRKRTRPEEASEPKADG